MTKRLARAGFLAFAFTFWTAPLSAKHTSALEQIRRSAFEVAERQAPARAVLPATGDSDGGDIFVRGRFVPEEPQAPEPATSTTPPRQD